MNTILFDSTQTIKDNQNKSFHTLNTPYLWKLDFGLNLNFCPLYWGRERDRGSRYILDCKGKGPAVRPTIQRPCIHHSPSVEENQTHHHLPPRNMWQNQDTTKYFMCLDG